MSFGFTVFIRAMRITIASLRSFCERKYDGVRLCRLRVPADAALSLPPALICPFPEHRMSWKITDGQCLPSTTRRPDFQRTEAASGFEAWRCVISTQLANIVPVLPRIG